MMAYCIASTFSDKTAFQGWEVQRHTLPRPQESIQDRVVSLLIFISVGLAFIPGACVRACMRVYVCVCFNLGTRHCT